jgi:hypothetical protein
MAPMRSQCRKIKVHPESSAVPVGEKASVQLLEPKSPNKQTSQERKKSGKGLGYSVNIQHVRNAGVLIQCDECNKWRLILSNESFLPRKSVSYRALSKTYHTPVALLFMTWVLPLVGVSIKATAVLSPLESSITLCMEWMIVFVSIVEAQVNYHCP